MNIKRFAGRTTKEGVPYMYINISTSYEIDKDVFESVQDYDVMYVESRLRNTKDIDIEPISDSDFPF